MMAGMAGCYLTWDLSRSHDTGAVLGSCGDDEGCDGKGDGRVARLEGVRWKGMIEVVLSCLDGGKRAQ